MAKDNIKPLADRVLIQINAAGPGRFDGDDRVPMDIKVGDTVVFSKYGGTELKYDGEEYLLLNSRDVLAIIEK